MRLAALLVVALVAGVASGEEAKESSELTGQWQFTEVEVSEKPAQLPERLPVWEIAGDKLLYARTELGTVTTNAENSPKTIDLTFLRSKKVYEGIYEVGPETLTICVNRRQDGVKVRPASLSTVDNPDFLKLTFRRIRDGEQPKAKGYLGLALDFDDKRSVVTVHSVLADSPAKESGLEPDDVLRTIDGTAAVNIEAAVAAARQAQPGVKLTIAFRRGDEDKETTLTVAAFPFEHYGILD